MTFDEFLRFILPPVCPVDKTTWLFPPLFILIPESNELVAGFIVASNQCPLCVEVCAIAPTTLKELIDVPPFKIVNSSM
jgi:hypothetical protein